MLDEHLAGDDESGQPTTNDWIAYEPGFFLKVDESSSQLMTAVVSTTNRKPLILHQFPDSLCRFEPWSPEWENDRG